MSTIPIKSTDIESCKVLVVNCEALEAISASRIVAQLLAEESKTTYSMTEHSWKTDPVAISSCKAVLVILTQDVSWVFPCGAFEVWQLKCGNLQLK